LYEIEKTNDMTKKAEQYLTVRKYESNKPEKKFITKKEDRFGQMAFEENA